jgi:hypothetical protein
MPLTIEQDGEQISFSLIGAERDGGFVRVGELAECFERLQECLRETERCLTGRASRLTYLVKQLTSGNPAVGVLVAKPTKKPSDLPRRVAHEFRRTVSELERGERRRNPQLDHDAYGAYRKLGSLIQKNDDRSRPKLIVDGVVVTHSYLLAAEKAMEFEESSVGTVSGVLEKIDVHGRNTFSIYPPIGGRQVTCVFAEDMLTKVQGALRKSVTVSGTLHFVADRFLPSKVEVTDLEVHPAVEDLPTLTSLAGRLSLPGGGGALAAKGRMRDEWHE